MLCRSRQAWSGLNGINTRSPWVDEAALAAALTETRPAPLAPLPKRFAIILINAAKVAAGVRDDFRELSTVCLVGRRGHAAAALRRPPPPQSHRAPGLRRAALRAALRPAAAHDAAAPLRDGPEARGVRSSKRTHPAVVEHQSEVARVDSSSTPPPLFETGLKPEV